MPVAMDPATLQAALVGYRQQLDQIEAKMAEIRRQLGKTGRSARTSLPQGSAPTPRKNRMSAEGRARIAAAQKARWARARKAAKRAEASE